MEEGKYGKYIVTEFYDGFELPEERAWEKEIMGRGLLNGQRRFMEHMVWMDSNVIPGAFYAEALSSNAVKDPFQNAHVFTESGPYKVSLLITSKPVDPENPWRVGKYSAHI